MCPRLGASLRKSYTSFYSNLDMVVKYILFPAAPTSFIIMTDNNIPTRLMNSILEERAMILSYYLYVILLAFQYPRNLAAVILANEFDYY